MPDMTEDSYVILLQRLEDLEKKVDQSIEENTNRVNDMSSLFKANMTVKTGNHDAKNQDDARHQELEKILKESLK